MSEAASPAPSPSPSPLSASSAASPTSSTSSSSSSPSSSSSSVTIQEHPISDSDLLKLEELRSLTNSLISSYRAHHTDPHWLKSHKIPTIHHWSVGNDKFRDSADDGVFTVPGIGPPPLPIPAPWQLGVSAFDVELPHRILYKFYKARSTLTASAEMLFKYLLWRDQYGVNELYSFHTQPYRRLWGSVVENSLHGFDKNDRLLYIERSGGIDPHRFAELTNDAEVTLTHVWQNEFMLQVCEERSKQLGRRVDKFSIVLDLGACGFGHRKMTSFFLTTVHIDQNYYPEALGCMYMINCPRVFPILWAIVKPFLSEETVAKMKPLGWHCEAQLVEELGADKLPVAYGGTCKCEGRMEGGCILKMQPMPNDIPHSKNWTPEMDEKKEDK